jgi:plasmid stabilization system protein ParE
MQLRWTASAADDLEVIAQYLFEKSPQYTAQLIRKIYEAPSCLKSYPNLGRLGKKDERVK